METTRMHIRPILETDFPEVFRLQSDPDVMRHIRPATDDPEVVRARLAEWMNYGLKQPGLGVFILEWKENRAFVGYVVARHVAFDPATEEYEVGYTIAPEYWGQGLASEVTPALCDYLFQLKKPDYVVAFTAFENNTSQKVLLKSGFTETGTRNIYDGGSKEFRIYRSETTNVKF